MNLGPGELPVQSWRTTSIEDFTVLLMSLSDQRRADPFILAVDGRSGGGKTTLAQRIHAISENSCVVHTDDVAWHHSFFGWEQLMIAGILKPLERGYAVNYRPPAWEEHGRPGAITIPVGCKLVIIEGVGASRSELGPWLSASVWIQSDMHEAERRGLERDGGTPEAKRFWDEWMQEENTFQAKQQPWNRAQVIVNGTPEIPPNPLTEVMFALNHQNAGKSFGKKP